MRHWKTIAAGIAAAGMLVGAAAIGYVIADLTNNPAPAPAAQAAETQPTTTTTTAPTTTTTTAPTIIATTVNAPSDMDFDTVNCVWLEKIIREVVAQSYEIFTFDKIQRIRTTSNKLWCQARVRASIGIIQIEYTIEEFREYGDEWYVTVQTIG